MMVSINQPAYLPWLGYFERIVNSDVHVVLDHVQFEKNSMVNRNKIYTANGACLLTVPIKTANKFGNLAINDVEINSQVKWQKKHWQSIYFNYKKAAFFNLYNEELETFYLIKWETLNSLLTAQCKFFLSKLNINTPVIYSSDLSLDQNKSELVLEICRQLKATEYISGRFGRDYLDLDVFKSNQIKVSFQDYTHPEYAQFGNPFISHLSVLDLMMHHGNKALEILKGT